MMMLAEIPGELIGVAMLIGLGGGLIAIVVAIVYRAEVKVARAREESRREIAAYSPRVRCRPRKAAGSWRRADR